MSLPQIAQQALDGYPKLSMHMSTYTDNAIYRKFGKLNKLNLLRLQAELQELEHQLLKIQEEDFESADAVRMAYGKDFRTMRDHSEVGDSEQYEHLLLIGQKLKEYNTALIQMLQLTKANQPTERELETLRNWLSQPDHGKAFLCGQEAKVWEGNHPSDFVTMAPRHLENDILTVFLQGRLLDIYHRIWGHKERKNLDQSQSEAGVRQYSEARISMISNVSAAMISSILPTLVILVLFWVKRMIVRIGLVIMFTAVFSFALAMFTAARKVDIFSATAAFAAVEVVFIGNTNSTS